MGRHLAIALGVAVLLIPAGCGGKQRLTNEAYSRNVTTIFVQLGGRFRAATPGRTQEEMSASLRAMKIALDQAAGRLRPLVPPGDAEQRHRTLLSATRDYARQVDLLRASVDFGDPATIATHLREVTAPRVLQRTIRSLNASGYRIPVTVVVLH
jgi:hypothetical protein